MKKRKLFSLFMVAVIIMGIIPGAAYSVQGDSREGNAPYFVDMPVNWSRAAIENAVENGLLTGYNGRIMPDERLTRAQLAAIISRAFGTYEEAPLDGYSDVDNAEWCRSAMAKAVHMKAFKGANGLLDPDRYITREEVFVVLCRVLKLSRASEHVLDKFFDSALISSWAEDAAAALVEGGYLSGSNGRLEPQKGITRAEMAQLMDNIIKRYAAKADVYSGDISGNLMVNVSGVILRDMRINGDLIIGDGVGDGDVTLENVVVTGRTLIRGGGTNSIVIKGRSLLGNIIIARINGQLRIYSETGAELGEIIADGSDDIIIEGTVEKLTIQASDITVTLKAGTIQDCIIKGDNVKLVAAEGAVIQKVTVNGEGAEISGKGSVMVVEAYAEGLRLMTTGTRLINAPGITVTFVDNKPAPAETGGTRDNDDDKPSSYMLKVNAKPANKGVVTGTGLYRSGRSIELTAAVADGSGYKFVNWTSAGQVISTEESFVFTMPAQNVTLVANFIPQDSVPVASAGNLQDIMNSPDGDYVQVADIDLGASPYNEGTGWEPIGDYDNCFTGSYDGNGYCIEELEISSEGSYSAGLFGVIDGAHIMNVRLKNADIEAYDYVGGMAGTSIDSIIEDCSVDGNVDGRYMVGGLVGLNDGGSITECHTKGTVNGDYIAGGLAGANGTSGKVEDCFSEADVSGYYITGGLTGKNLGSVESCYSEGVVTAGEIDADSPKIQAARVESFNTLYGAIARRPEMLEELIAIAKELTGEAGDLSSPEVQAARVASFSALYEAIARQPEMMEELIATAKELTGEAGDLSSPEVQAARVLSFSALYEAIARQPEMMEELITTAKVLTGEAGDLSSPEMQAARVTSFGKLYLAISRQPELSEELIATAKELAGEAGDLTSPEVQAARAASFSSLYEAIARQPEMLEELVAIAKELTGEAGDLSSPEAQSARVASFSALYQWIARQPEMMEELIATAKELTGEAGDLSSPEVQAARVTSFSALYEAIVRQPELSEELIATAKELAGEAGDLSSSEVQAARAASFSALYEAIARQPEMMGVLKETAKELTGEAGDLSSPEVQAARVASFSALYQAISRQPELSEELIATAKELTGEAGDLLSPEVQAARASSFGGLYEAIARQPEMAETLIGIARELAGELWDLTSPGVQKARLQNAGIMLDHIAAHPYLEEVLINADKELCGEYGGWTSDELQAVRIVSQSALYDMIAQDPASSELLIEKAGEYIGRMEDWSLPKVQTGGLIGLNTGTITSAYSTARVIGRYYSGGLTGCNSGSIIGSYAVNSELRNSIGIVEGLSSGRIVGTNTGVLEQNYASKLITEPFPGAFEKKNMVHVRKDGGNLASWFIAGNGTITAVPEAYMLLADPAQVELSDSFDSIFTLTLTNDTVTGAVYSSDLLLGGCFSGLSFSSISMTDETTVTAHVYGSLMELGIGTITINKSALLLSPDSLTAEVKVVSETGKQSNQDSFLEFSRKDVIIGQSKEGYYVIKR